jgi:hypothetical protein
MWIRLGAEINTEKFWWGNLSESGHLQEIESGVKSIFICILIKQVKNVEYFRYLSSMITNDARCTREIKSRIVGAKAELKKQKTLFTSKLDLHLRKKLVKCYIWSIALYDAELWTLRKVDQKYFESFFM